MLKKRITFTDFNGNEVTEDHFFHLSAADLVELEMSQKGGLSTWLQTVIDSEDGAEIMSQFKKLILLSYGQKSEDGRRFIKNEKLTEEFRSSEAFSELFVELCTNADAAAEFANGIIPPNLERLQAKTQNDPERPNFLTEPRYITRAEAYEMDSDELTNLLSQGAILQK